MSTYLKPQSPLYHKTEDAYFYPLTTADQIVMDNGSRLNTEIAKYVSVDTEDAAIGEVNPINADTLGGVLASEYAKQVDLENLENNLNNLDTGVHMELLWENASPSSEFAAQTLTIENLDDYDAFILYVDANSNVENRYGNGSLFFDKTSTNLAICVSIYYAGVSKFFFRRFTVDFPAGTVTFGNGDNNDSAGAQYLIPLSIYGIKGVN